MKRWSIALAALIGLAQAPAFAQTPVVCQPSAPCVVEWSANTEPDIAEYRLYVGTQSGQYDFTAPALVIRHPVVNAALGTVRTFTDGTYFIVLKAVDTSGNESGPSNEVSFRYDGPPSVPRITIRVSVP